jgi:hypothetical protein
MNAETIAAARENLRKRKAEADEALRALDAAPNPRARSLAYDIVQSRTLAVDQSAAYLAATMAAEKAMAAIPSFNRLIGDMAFIVGLHRKARSIGALPAYLEALTSNPEFAQAAKLASQMPNEAKNRVDTLLKALKRNPMAELV